MATPVIERTPQQRDDALRLANQVRMRRAEIKRRIAEGHLTATECVRDLERATDRMRVRDLIMSVPTFGRVKTARAMRQLRISDSKTLGGISDRQRVELLGYLDGR